MTEAQWLACADPTLMLDFLKDRASDRKLRLHAVACCRRVEHLFGDDRCRTALGMAERLADDASLEAKAAGVAARLEEVESSSPAADAAWNAVRCALSASGDWVSPRSALDTGDDLYLVRNAPHWASKAAFAAAMDGSDDPSLWRNAESLEMTEQARMLTDIFGNPIRPITLASSCLNVAVVSLATTIYEERAFERMPELAEALEQTGCTNADILAHCRQPIAHVRGCWVIDLLLGKE